VSRKEKRTLIAERALFALERYRHVGGEFERGGVGWRAENKFSGGNAEPPFRGQCHPPDGRYLNAHWALRQAWYGFRFRGTRKSS